MSLFQDLSAFPITPADPSGAVCAEAFSRILHRLIEAGVDSIGLLGSTGAYAYLTRQERRRAVEAAVQVANGRTPLMVGVSALRTDEACQLARDAAEAGADALLLAPMSYTPLKDEEVFEHYAAVADATALPLCIYNNPGTTRFTFGLDLLHRLAAVPRIVAVKMPLPSDTDFAGELARLRGGPSRALAIGYSADWGMADALLAGADAFYSALAGVLPREILTLARAAEAGDLSEARRIDAALQPLWSLCRVWGGLRVSYAIAGIRGLAQADPPRPLLSLPASEHTGLVEALSAIETAFSA